jgi:hypothetical protein
VPDPQYPPLLNRPHNPRKFQIGLSIQPEQAEIGPFTLMTFTAFVSPPYTDLFDFHWELDGQPASDTIGPTFQKPVAALSPTPDGQHTVRMTAVGAREYRDATDARYNFVPFDGGAVTVQCSFTAPSG